MLYSTCLTMPIFCAWVHLVYLISTLAPFYFSNLQYHLYICNFSIDYSMLIEVDVEITLYICVLTSEINVQHYCYFKPL